MAASERGQDEGDFSHPLTPSFPEGRRFPSFTALVAKTGLLNGQIVCRRHLRQPGNALISSARIPGTKPETGHGSRVHKSPNGGGTGDRGSMRLRLKRTAGSLRSLRTLRSLRSKPLSYIRLAAKRRRRFPIFPLRKPQKIYGRIGSLEVRLARSIADIKKAQRLRFEVFYKEMDAVPDARTLLKKRDEDDYDAICDHLLVIDKTVGRTGKRPWLKRAKVVGTYRVLGQEAAERNQGFYTQREYDIAPLIARKRNTNRFLELGRSCVLKPYRNRRTVELLWQGLWTYIREHGYDVMLGCASFPGTDPKEHALALSFLHHYRRAPEEWLAPVHPHLKAEMNLMPKEDVNLKEALKVMPPLIKGYLRLGAFVGDGAYVDHQFGTTDVLIIMPVSAIDTRYFSHFGAPDEVLPQTAGRRSRQGR
jgi:putative hemolysin